MISWAATPERIVAHNTLNIDWRLFVERRVHKNLLLTTLIKAYTRVKIVYDVVFILELYDHIFVDCYDDFRA